MTSPTGKNNSKALHIFSQRKMYKDLSYPRTPLFSTPIDLWNEKQFYGKVNEKRDAVYLSEAFLKQINVDGEAIFALNFVVDAFENMKRAWNEKATLGKVNMDSELAELTPATAWTSINTLHHDHIFNMYDAFSNVFVKENERYKKILDFKSFVKIFVQFIDRMVLTFSFTKTGFLLSKNCPASVGGLMIELAEQDYGNDQVKFENFLDDTNFSLFTKIAEDYGFKVDENIPWRLVADLASEPMKRYMEPYNISLDNLFDEYYYKTYELDIETLKVHLFQFYNSYVAANPYVQISKVSQCKNKVVTEVFNRQIISARELERNFDDKFWLRLFLYVRAKETNQSFTQRKFDLFVNKVLDIYSTLGLNKAVEFAAKNLKGGPATLEERSKEFFEKKLPEDWEANKASFSFL